MSSLFNSINEPSNNTRYIIFFTIFFSSYFDIACCNWCIIKIISIVD